MRKSNSQKEFKIGDLVLWQNVEVGKVHAYHSPDPRRIKVKFPGESHPAIVFKKDLEHVLPKK